MLDQWKKRKDNTWLRRYYEWRDRQARHITVIYSISVCFHDLQKRFSNNLNTHFRCCWLIYHIAPQSLSLLYIAILVIIIPLLSESDSQAYYAHARSFARSLFVSLSLSVITLLLHSGSSGVESATLVEHLKHVAKTVYSGNCWRPDKIATTPCHHKTKIPIDTDIYTNI